MWIIPVLFLCLLTACTKQTSSPPQKTTDTVTLTDNGTSVILRNSHISFTIDKGNAETSYSSLPGPANDSAMPRVAVQGIYRAQGKRIGDVYTSVMYDFLRLDVDQAHK